MDEFVQLLSTVKFPAEVAAAKTATIHDSLLRSSRYVRTGNFQAIHPEDLRFLFTAYDSTFFGGQIARQLGTTPLHFYLSKRLTSAGGKTTRRKTSRAATAPVIDFSISISTTLLFQTFQDVDRVVTVGGLECADRLAALQRVFEHELIHLVEMLAWDDSSCAGGRFQTMAAQFFGHRQHTHRLITQRERAWSKFGFRLGDRVAFRLDGRHYEGVLNRLTRRATVLVEDSKGVRYTDGKHYRKFYVPLEQLGLSGSAASESYKTK